MALIKKMENNDLQRRIFRRSIRRVVVKLGSSQIVDGKFRTRKETLKSLTEQIGQLHKRNIEVVVVSSGAIALGMGELGENRRPTDLGALQARAAIGQAILMRNYIESFRKVNLRCAQVLLTWDDFAKRNRSLNVQHTLSALLQKGIVPIINENDTTSTEEIKFGDNDKLSALVANLWQANLLVMLSDVDGLWDANKNIYPEIKNITRKIMMVSRGTSNGHVARGGMKTKLEAVKTAREKKIPSIIARGNLNNVLINITIGKKIGTYFK